MWRYYFYRYQIPFIVVSIGVILTVAVLVLVWRS